MATTKELIEAAYSHVFDGEIAFCQAIAAENTIANMGQRLEDLIDCNAKPERLFIWAYGTLANNCACEGIDIEDEFAYWKKAAPLYVKAIKKAGLPMTVRSSESVKVKLPKMGRR
jgi:hypothetical protein